MPFRPPAITAAAAAESSWSLSRLDPLFPVPPAGAKRRQLPSPLRRRSWPRRSDRLHGSSSGSIRAEAVIADDESSEEQSGARSHESLPAHVPPDPFDPDAEHDLLQSERLLEEWCKRSVRIAFATSSALCRPTAAEATGERIPESIRGLLTAPTPRKRPAREAGTQGPSKEPASRRDAARKHPSVLDLVGSTPIVRLDRISRDVPGMLLLREARVPESRRLGQGPDRPRDDRGGERDGSLKPAERSSSRPPATPAVAASRLGLSQPRSRATAASS